MSARARRIDGIIERLLAEQTDRPGNVGTDLRRLWRDHLRSRAAMLVWAMVLTVVVSAIPMGFTLTNRFMIDDVLLGGSVPAAVADHHAALCLLFFAMNMTLWGLRLSSNWIRTRIIVGAGQGMVYSLRKGLHEKLQSLHVGFFEATPVGIIMARVLDDVSIIHKWVTRHGPAVLTCALQIVIGLATLMVLQWRLGLIVLASMPLYVWAFAVLRPKIRRTNKATRRLTAKMYARSAERIGGIGVVKAFAREQAEVRSFAGLIHDGVRVAMRLVQYRQFLAISAGLITSLATGVIVYVGCTFVRDGTMTIGELIAFKGMMAMLYHPVNRVTSLATAMQAALVVLRRIFAVLDEPEEVAPGRISLDGMAGKIEFDRVTYIYPRQETPALDEVDFRIAPGQTVALMGPSGAGKTTVFQLLLRFYHPQGGHVRVGGVDLVDADPASIRRHIRVVQQEPTIFSGTISDNIRYGKLDADEDAIRRAAAQAELHEFIDELPAAYDTMVGENGVTLSGGQKQRLALATALLTDPEVLLLDDTTSALDSATEARIRETLRHALAGRTSLIITQRIATARQCDRILVFEGGRITQRGTHEDLKGAPGFYAHICREQAQA